MGISKDLINFVFNKRNIHQIFFILPIVIFYLTNQSDWILLISIIVLAITEIYQIDLNNKVNLIIKQRVNQISKNKPFIRNWKDQLKDAKKEFFYLPAWPIFGLVTLIFFAEFVYSTYLSYFYSKTLFGIHIFLIVYMSFLDVIIGHNFKILAKNKNFKKKK